MRRRTTDREATPGVTGRLREFFFREEVPYGLAVARLAGLPEMVTHRAAEVLARLEHGRAKTGGIAAGLSDLPLFSAAAPPPPARDAVREALAALRPDEMSPRAALDALYDLKRLADER